MLTDQARLHPRRTRLAVIDFTYVGDAAHNSSSERFDRGDSFGQILCSLPSGRHRVNLSTDVNRNDVSTFIRQAAPRDFFLGHAQHRL